MCQICQTIAVDTPTFVCMLNAIGFSTFIAIYFKRTSLKVFEILAYVVLALFLFSLLAVILAKVMDWKFAFQRLNGQKPMGYHVNGAKTGWATPNANILTGTLGEWINWFAISLGWGGSNSLKKKIRIAKHEKNHELDFEFDITAGKGKRSWAAVRPQQAHAKTFNA